MLVYAFSYKYKLPVQIFQKSRYDLLQGWGGTPAVREGEEMIVTLGFEKSFVNQWMWALGWRIFVSLRHSQFRHMPNKSVIAHRTDVKQIYSKNMIIFDDEIED